MTPPPQQPTEHIVDVPSGPADTKYRTKLVMGRRLLIRLVFTLLLPLAGIKLQSPALTSDYSVQVCCLVFAGFVYCMLTEIVENPNAESDRSPNQDYVEIVLHTCLIIIATSLVTLLLPPKESLLALIALISVFIPVLVAVWFKTKIYGIFNDIFSHVMSRNMFADKLARVTNA